MHIYDFLYQKQSWMKDIKDSNLYIPCCQFKKISLRTNSSCQKHKNRRKLNQLFTMLTVFKIYRLISSKRVIFN